MGQGQRSQSTFSAIYCIKLPNDVDDMVKSSNKNTQELTNVQEADPDRVNRRELHGQTAPDLVVDGRTGLALSQCMGRVGQAPGVMHDAIQSAN